MRAELDRVVPLGEGSLPFLWVHAAGPEQFAGFEERLSAEPTVESVTELDAFDDRRLYRFAWADGANAFLRRLESASAALLEARGDDETWEFEMRFPTQDALSEFHEYCTDDDVGIEITGVSRFQPNENHEHGLTPSQRETLLEALDAGFYNIPRDLTTVEFADDLGISDQSLSERLRRAHATLVENALR